MNSSYLNMAAAAFLGTVFVVLTLSIVSEGLYHAPEPETPGYAIEVAEAPAGGGDAAAPAANEVTPIAPLLASADPAAGEAVFKKCQACHSGEKGGPNKVGPNLWGVVGRPIASHEGFGYSAALTAFSDGGQKKWTYDELNHFIHGPKSYVKGTAMGFAGLTKDDERANVIAYLRTLSDNPEPLPDPNAAPAAGDAAAPAGDAAPAEAPAAAPAN